MKALRVPPNKALSLGGVMHSHVTFVATAAFLFFGSSAASATDFTGFWKGACTDAFGISIKPDGSKSYSISFCGPGGCGRWMPNTAVEGDPSYRVLGPDTLEVRKGDRWRRFQKCTTETNPKLDYSTMQGQPRPNDPGGGVRVKRYYQGIPDYENLAVFHAEPASIHLQLKTLLKEAPVSSTLCVRGSVKATVLPSYQLRSNICDSSAYSAIKALIAQLGASLDVQRWSFRKVDLDRDGEPEAMIEYVDLIGDTKVKDPYLSLWHLRHDGSVYRPTYAGPFLAGRIHAQMAFGQSRDRNVVFIRHSSCTECHPWIYLTVVDFFPRPSGAAFEFTYDNDHKTFKYEIEYVLPGKGHSVDAKVETRVLAATPGGPHLIQQFRLDDGKTEWWVFRCEKFKCDYEMYDELPSKYWQAWQQGKKV
jgi:hypothetical protein